MLTKAALEKLARTHQKKAEEAYDNYRQTGITRYDTARRKNEDLADAFRMALDAKDEHDALIAMRGAVAGLAVRARRELDEGDCTGVAREILAYARLWGLIREEENPTSLT